MHLYRKELIEDIFPLIELSAVRYEKFDIFSEFHKTIISLTHGATDIIIDYRTKEIIMNVLAEHSKGDFLWRWDSLAPVEECLNVNYENLCDYLKESIAKKHLVSKEHCTLLKENFMEGKLLLEKIRCQELV